MSNTFKTWLQNEYEHNTLADIANHGCAGGIGGLIYYKETEAVYKEHQEALHDILNEYKEAIGEWPDYVVKELGNASCFMNAVVWFCAEWVAQEITQGEYVHEEA
jgi:hypothetical protein